MLLDSDLYSQKRIQTPIQDIQMNAESDPDPQHF